MKAVVVNAGCANAVTGKEGLDAAKRVRALTRQGARDQAAAAAPSGGKKEPAGAKR